MQRLGPKKEDKTVLDNGLLCADQVFDFVQEMGGIKLTFKGLVSPKEISSLVLICDAKTWSPPPLKKKKLFWTVYCLHVLIGCLTLYRRWEA